MIALIVLESHTLLAPVAKEIVVNAALGGTRVNRNTWLVRWTGFNGIAPGGICNSVSVVEPPSLVLIVIVFTYPPCSLELRCKPACCK